MGRGLRYSYHVDVVKVHVTNKGDKGLDQSLVGVVKNRPSASMNNERFDALYPLL